MLANRSRNTSKKQKFQVTDIAAPLSTSNTRGKRSAAFFKFSIGAAALIQKCSALVDEAYQMAVNSLLENRDLYETCLNVDAHEMRIWLNKFLNSEAWQEKIVQWSELGVCYLNSENETPPKDLVCILIKKDVEGLPYYLNCFTNSFMSKHSFCVDLIKFNEIRERLLKYNLTYVRDFESVLNEIDILTEKLHKSNNATRLSLLNTFNQKWLGQLEVTYTLNHQTHNSTVKVVDTSGEVITEDNFNRIFIEQQSGDATPAMNVKKRTLNAHQYFHSPTEDTLINDDTNKSPKRNGTQRYDLRKIEHKSSYPL